MSKTKYVHLGFNITKQEADRFRSVAGKIGYTYTDLLRKLTQLAELKGIDKELN